MRVDCIMKKLHFTEQCITPSKRCIFSYLAIQNVSGETLEIHYETETNSEKKI